MTASALMGCLSRRGVRLTAQEERLVIDAPRGVLTDADREELRAHKAELVALLTPPPTTSEGGFGQPPVITGIDVVTPDRAKMVAAVTEVLIERAKRQGGTWTHPECLDIDFDTDVRDLIV